MARTYTELYYHLVWSTKDRLALITTEIEAPLYRAILGKCKELEAVVHAVGGTADHVHLVCCIPAKIAVSEFMERIKGSSSHMINHMPGERILYWQASYGALTSPKRDLKGIITYVQNQKGHHSSGDVHLKMEKTSNDQ